MKSDFDPREHAKHNTYCLHGYLNMGDCQTCSFQIMKLEGEEKKKMCDEIEWLENLISESFMLDVSPTSYGGLDSKYITYEDDMEKFKERLKEKIMEDRKESRREGFEGGAERFKLYKPEQWYIDEEFKKWEEEKRRAENED